MKSLGIDPGLTKCGWGIILANGNHLSYVASGLIKPDPSRILARRLCFIHEHIADIIKDYSPDAAAIEETFVNKNPSSALKLGQARGVALAVPALYGIEVAEYGANKIKKSIVGNGHATKEQMGMMVKTLLPACGKLSEDEADALAVAMTHAHYGAWNNRVANAI